MEEKKCFKCHQTKPLEEFYRHPMMADGRLGKCKECTKRDVANRYRSEEGRKRVVQYEKARFQSPERKKKLIEYQRSSRAKNKMKYQARTKFGNAVRAGKIIPLPCEVCGSLESQGHHEDYSKPFDVRWMCFRHHREIGHNQTVS